MSESADLHPECADCDGHGDCRWCGGEEGGCHACRFTGACWVCGGTGGLPSWNDAVAPDGTRLLAPSADTQAALRAGGAIARIDGEWVGLEESCQDGAPRKVYTSDEGWHYVMDWWPLYRRRALPAPSPEETP